MPIRTDDFSVDSGAKISVKWNKIPWKRYEWFAAGEKWNWRCNERWNFEWEHVDMWRRLLVTSISCKCNYGDCYRSDASLNSTHFNWMILYIFDAFSATTNIIFTKNQYGNESVRKKEPSSPSPRRHQQHNHQEVHCVAVSSTKQLATNSIRGTSTMAARASRTEVISFNKAEKSQHNFTLSYSIHLFASLATIFLWSSTMLRQ